jgi:hypothetical protein
MSEKKETGLARFTPNTVEQLIPKIDVSALPKEKIEELTIKMAEYQYKTVSEIQANVIQSKIAENDLANIISISNTMAAEGKVFTISGDFKTGSGSCKITTKGGDPKFLTLILAVIGISVLTAILIIF